MWWWVRKKALFLPITTSQLFMNKERIDQSSWSNWQWQLANLIRKPEHLSRFFLTSPELQKHIEFPFQNKSISSFRLTPYLASLIDWSNTKDPIFLQHLPDIRETQSDDFQFQTVWEQPEDFTEVENRFIQQKYRDIILLRLTSTCHSYCRFCFEKERTLLQAVPTDTGESQWQKALQTISETKDVYQVLVSGGDPLILTDEILLARLRDLAMLPNIRIIRVNTRSWLHNPFRFTESFTRDLQTLIEDMWKLKPEGISLRFGIHANHPQEITPEARTAFRRMRKAGVQLYNQTVLLKGVNDEVEVLASLFRQLREEGIELHYLSHAMPVPGTKHLRTSVRRGQELLQKLREKEEFRGALPAYELSFHKGKQMIPTVMHDCFTEEVVLKDGKKRPVIRFYSDITHQEEIYPDERGL
jgi:lysine 2,3-aminomutase